MPACEKCGTPQAAAVKAQVPAPSAGATPEEIQQVVQIVQQVLASQNFH